MNVTYHTNALRKQARGGDRQRCRDSRNRDSNQHPHNVPKNYSDNSNKAKHPNHTDLNRNQRFGNSSPPRRNQFNGPPRNDKPSTPKRVSWAPQGPTINHQQSPFVRKEFVPAQTTKQHVEHHARCKKSEKNQRTAMWVQSQLNQRIRSPSPQPEQVRPIVKEERPSATPFLDNYLYHYGEHTCNRHKWNTVRVPVQNKAKEADKKPVNRAHGLHNQRIKNWDQSATRRIGRSSSPAPHYCYHCEHDHRRDCCLQPGDSNEDIAGFADWISELETKEAKPVPFLDIPETVSGSISPPWFPKCLPVPSKNVKQEQMPACSAVPPMGHQCFVPVYGPNVRVVPVNGYQQIQTPEGLVYLVPQVAGHPHGAFNQFMRQYFHYPQVYLVQPKPCAKPCPVHTWIPGMYMQPPTYPATHLLQQLTHQYCSTES